MPPLDSKLLINLKLNATTFSVQAPNAHKTLKVSLTPYLTTHHSSPLTPLTRVKKDADSIFEVLVAVGGKIGVDLEVDGVEGLTGCVSEWETEGYIKEEVVKTFKRVSKKVRMTLGGYKLTKENRGTLCLERVDTSVGDTLTLHPTAATASRAAILTSLLPCDTPVAYLTKLEIALTWVGGMAGVPVAETTESQSSSATADDVLLSTDDELEIASLPKPSGNVHDTGPPPNWLKEQLGSATSKLIRLELIKRFPLIFDPAFPAYLARCTPPQSLELAFNHCLSFAQTHSTPLFEQGKERLQAIINSQAAAVAHRRAVVEGVLIKATGSKRQKTASGPPGDTPPSTDSSSDGFEAISPIKEATGPTMSGILLQSLSQIGRDRWTRARTHGRSRLSCQRIKLVGEADATPEFAEIVKHQPRAENASWVPPAAPPLYTGLFDDSMLDDSDDDEFLADSDLEDEGAAQWDHQAFLSDDDIIDDQDHLSSDPSRTPPAYASTISSGNQLGGEYSDDHIHYAFQTPEHPHYPTSPALYPPNLTYDQHMLDDSESDDLDSIISLLSLEDKQTSDSLSSQPPTPAWTAVPQSNYTLIRESASVNNLDDLFFDDDDLDMDDCKDPGPASLVQYSYSIQHPPYAVVAPLQPCHTMDWEPARKLEDLIDLDELDVKPGDVFDHSADILEDSDDEF